MKKIILAGITGAAVIILSGCGGYVPIGSDGEVDSKSNFAPFTSYFKVNAADGRTIPCIWGYIGDNSNGSLSCDWNAGQ